MPGYLTPCDLVNFDSADLLASEGATVVKDGKRLQLPTLVPKQKEDGSCVFLSDSGCTVHGCAPYGCRVFTVCEDWTDDHAEREIGLIEIWKDMEQNGEYSRTVEELKQNGQNARKLSVRLTNFQNALRELES